MFKNGGIYMRDGWKPGFEISIGFSVKIPGVWLYIWNEKVIDLCHIVDFFPYLLMRLSTRAFLKCNVSEGVRYMVG